jgi:hypothetical protein
MWTFGQNDPGGVILDFVFASLPLPLGNFTEWLAARMQYLLASGESRTVRENPR